MFDYENERIVLLCERRDGEECSEADEQSN